MRKSLLFVLMNISLCSWANIPEWMFGEWKVSGSAFNSNDICQYFSCHRPVVELREKSFTWKLIIDKDKFLLGCEDDKEMKNCFSRCKKPRYSYKKQNGQEYAKQKNLSASQLGAVNSSIELAVLEINCSDSDMEKYYPKSFTSVLGDASDQRQMRYNSEDLFMSFVKK